MFRKVEGIFNARARSMQAHFRRERLAKSGCEKKAKIKKRDDMRLAHEDVVDVRTPILEPELPGTATVLDGDLSEAAAITGMEELTMEDVVDFADVPSPAFMTGIDPGRVYTLFNAAEEFPDGGFHIVNQEDLGKRFDLGLER